MGRLSELLPAEPVHQRGIQINSYVVEPGRLLVEGRLVDERRVHGYHWSGEPRDPGLVHDIVVRWLVGEWPLRILQAEAEMPHVPHEKCGLILDAVKQIEGLSIAAGFSARVLKLLGGVRGCTHMAHLIVAMAPAALHGYWTQRSRRRRPLPRNKEEIPGLDSIVNSCHLWAPDGPLMRLVETTLAAAEQQQAD